MNNYELPETLIAKLNSEKKKLVVDYIGKGYDNYYKGLWSWSELEEFLTKIVGL